MLSHFLFWNDVALGRLTCTRMNISASGHTFAQIRGIQTQYFHIYVPVSFQYAVKWICWLKLFWLLQILCTILPNTNKFTVWPDPMRRVLILNLNNKSYHIVGVELTWKVNSEIEVRKCLVFWKKNWTKVQKQPNLMSNHFSLQVLHI